jgi:hypothetical protein
MWRMLTAIGGVLKEYAPLLATAAAACAAVFAWWNARNGARAIAANLLLTFMRDYRSEDFAEAIRRLRQFKEGSTHAQGFAVDYADRVQRNDPTVADLRKYRRTVAQFFNTLRALCSNKLLGRALVADAFGRAFFEFYLDVLEPMDKAEAHLRPGPHEDARPFFQTLVDECFPSR